MLFVVALVEEHVCGGNADGAATRHRVLGVDRQVENRIFELAGIRECAREVGIEQDPDVDLLAQRALHQLAHSGDELVAVDLDRIKRLAPPKGEQALGEFGTALTGLHDQIGEPLKIVARFEFLGQELGIADDHGEQVVEIMRDAAGKLPGRFHFLRLDELFLGVLALGEIVDDANENGLAFLLGLAD